MKEIREENRTIQIESAQYLITAVPFYNQQTENDFKIELEAVIE